MMALWHGPNARDNQSRCTWEPLIQLTLGLPDRKGNNMTDRMSLFMSMINRTPLRVNGVSFPFIIDAIEMEDGSGFSFNLTVQIVMRKDAERIPTPNVRKIYFNTETNQGCITADPYPFMANDGQCFATREELNTYLTRI
jgi:hypothetical protein